MGGRADGCRQQAWANTALDGVFDFFQRFEDLGCSVTGWFAMRDESLHLDWLSVSEM